MKKTAPKKTRKTPRKILSPGEPKPFLLENPKGQGAGLIICDHASNRIPLSLKDMGLKKTDLKKHIAWDIGCAEIVRYLSKELDMPGVLAVYSRLVTDLNRDPQHHECMPETSDHIKIPANASLSAAVREQRLKEIYWPYQKYIGSLVERLVKNRRVPVLIAIHSLTPVMEGIRRPWHISVLWHKEEKIAKKLVQSIRKNHPGFLVGENEPYSLFNERFKGSTIWRHAEERGLPYVFVEFRQDLVNTEEKALHWAQIFAEALKPLLESPEVYRGRKIKPNKK
jgi:predicted N-formylglutamate amidohydrolase